MTTVISRLYEDHGTAEAVATRLRGAGFPANALDIIQQTGDDSAVDRLVDAKVSEATAQLYAQHLTPERAILVVRAPLYPLGAAMRAQDEADASPAVDLGEGVGDEYVREQPRRDLYLSVLTDHPRWFSGDIVPGSRRYRTSFSSAFGIPILSRRTRKSSVGEGGPITTRFLPFDLLSSRPRKNSTISGGGLTLSRILGWKPITSRGDRA